ncbi:MAG: hypothetical protein HKL90_16395 [Elusimicrobia bacterium]|nr:hypothetical protein [Elusimicrobiota bacterium]
MDPKTKVPEIKPDVNREKDRERKKGGFLTRLFGAGAAEGGAGLSGGVVDIGGAAVGGGLLATKAGLIALLVAGSTVAAGIGLVGYRAFGPGADQNSENNLALFAPRPKTTAGPTAPAPGSRSGTSPSLGMLTQANSGGSGGASGGLQDQAAASAASASASAGAQNSADGGTAMSGSGGGASGQPMANIAKFGALGASTGGGSGGGAVSSAASPQPHAVASANAASKGNLSGMMGKSGPGARSNSAMARSFNHSNGAAGQAFSALGNQRGGMASSSYSAGQTYDGSAGVGGSAVGPSAGLPSVAGASESGGQAAAKSTPNTATPGSQVQPPPIPPATNVTPWQGDIQAAEMLLGLGVVLLFAKKMIAKMFYAAGATGLGTGAAFLAAKIIDGLIMATGLAIIALGARVSGGAYGQVLQGRILAAAGTGLILAGAVSMYEDLNPASGVTEASQYGDAASSAGVGSSTTGALSGINPFVLAGGGAAAVGLAASMLSPKMQYPSTNFNNGIPPGQGMFSMGRMPSQDGVSFRALNGSEKAELS